MHFLLWLKIFILEIQSQVSDIASPSRIETLQCCAKINVMSYRAKGLVYVKILLYYLLSLKYIYRTPAIVNPICDDSHFFPSRCATPSFPQNSAIQRAIMQPILPSNATPYDAGM